MEMIRPRPQNAPVLLLGKPWSSCSSLELSARACYHLVATGDRAMQRGGHIPVPMQDPQAGGGLWPFLGAAGAGVYPKGA